MNGAAYDSRLLDDAAIRPDAPMGPGQSMLCGYLRGGMSAYLLNDNRLGKL